MSPTSATPDILENKQFLFIVGSPRSGTTWIQTLLAAHPQVATTVELTLFERYVGTWVTAWEREAGNINQGKWHQGLPFLWEEEEFEDYLREFVARTYAKIAAKNPGASHVLDKYPAYALHTATIRHFIPHARFIHVLRDGRDVVVSMLAARRNVGFGATNITSAANEWLRMVEGAREASQYAGSYLEVRYEDVLDNPQVALKTLYEFCDLDASETMIAGIASDHDFAKMKARRQTADPDTKAAEGHYWRGKSGNWQAELSSLEQFQLERLIGVKLRELGYAAPGWWAESAAGKITTPILYFSWRVIARLRNAWRVLYR